MNKMNIDADPTYQRWNQPVYAYDLKSSSSVPPLLLQVSPSKGIRTELEYTLEIEPHGFPPLGQASKPPRS